MEAFVQHTWCIHHMPSPFPSPLKQSVAAMNEGAVKALRQRPQARARGYDKEGDYVVVEWISASKEQSLDNDATGGEQGSDEASSAASSRKRTRSQAQQGSDCATRQQHLRVQVFVQEAWSAEVIFCFASNGISTSRYTEAFSFCLVRGSKASYEAIWQWFEASTGSFVGKVPVGPTSAELASLVVQWTTASLVQSNAEDNGGKISAKPLVLTFAVPSSLEGSGLENLSLTIPPASLSHLCINIEKERPRPSTEEDGNEAESDTSGRDLDESLPILKALQAFVKKSFSLNVESFSLVKASCAVASCGCDGRCKPLGLDFLNKVLGGIDKMVTKRFARGNSTLQQDANGV